MVFTHDGDDLSQLASIERVVLNDLNRLQSDLRTTLCPLNVDVSRIVIVSKYDESISTDTQYGWHQRGLPHRLFFALHPAHKLIEQIKRVVGAGGGFRVVLHAERA